MARPAKNNEKRGPSREEMIRIIRGGGSVLINGKIIEKVSGLPSPIEMAGDDPALKAQARADIISERDRLNALLGDTEMVDNGSGLLIPAGSNDTDEDDEDDTDTDDTDDDAPDAELQEAVDDIEGEGGEVEPDLSLPDGAEAKKTRGGKK